MKFFILTSAILLGMLPVKEVSAQFDPSTFNEDALRIINDEGVAIIAHDEHCTSDPVATRLFAVEDHVVSINEIPNTLIAFNDTLRGVVIRIGGTLRYMGSYSFYLDGLFFGQTPYFMTPDEEAANVPLIAMPFAPSAKLMRRTTIEMPLYEEIVSNDELRVGMFSYKSRSGPNQGDTCFIKNPNVNHTGMVQAMREMEDRANVITPNAMWTGQYGDPNKTFTSNTTSNSVSRKKRSTPEFGYDVGRLVDIIRDSNNPCEMQIYKIIDGTITTCDQLENYGICVDQYGWQCWGSAWDHHLIEVRAECNAQVAHALTFITRCQGLKIIRETSAAITAVVEQILEVNVDLGAVVDTQKVLVTQSTDVHNILRDNGLAIRSLGDAHDGLAVDVVGLSGRVNNQTGAIWTQLEKLSLRVYMLGEETRESHEQLMATASMLRGESQYRTNALADRVLESEHYFANITTDHTEKIEANIKQNEELLVNLEATEKRVSDRTVALRAAIADLNNATAEADLALARSIESRTMGVGGSTSSALGLGGAIGGGVAILIIVVLLLCCACKK